MNEIITGDALTVLEELPDASVQMCVTSPPYYGLRDYSTEVIFQFGDDPNVDCQHTWIREGRDENGAKVAECALCSAVKVDQQIGLEETPQEYIAKLVAVFREVRRVLRNDGTLWLNLGDSYAAGKAGRTDYGTGDPTSTLGPKHDGLPHNTRPGMVVERKAPAGFKPKDLMMIPARVAIALQEDGWYLRSDIIWAKSNCMPESVTDRPTSAHEHIFLFAKSERYYYDADAIREPLRPKTYTTFGTKHHAQGNDALGLVKSDNWGRTVVERKPRLDAQGDIAGANKRDVWTVASQPYSEAHFATFPPKLIEPCILAGSRPGDIVLDCFCGAGTTPLVAIQHHRHYIGIELNPEYCALAKKRIETTQVTLWEVLA